jgi:hypothetical protein
MLCINRKVQGDKAVYLRQSIDLTGLNSTSFKNSIETIRYLFSQLERNVPSNKLEDFQPNTYGLHTRLVISNRYFSSRNNSELSSIVAFNPTTDPYKILSNLRHNNLVHTTDNEVLFYNSVGSSHTSRPKRVMFHYNGERRFKCSTNAIHRFIPVAPTIFKEGDIVEVQMTIIATPIKDKRLKLIFQLRSIALLDCSFAQVSNIYMFIF